MLVDNFHNLFTEPDSMNEKKVEFWKQGKPFDVFLTLDGIGPVSSLYVTIKLGTPL